MLPLPLFFYIFPSAAKLHGRIYDRQRFWVFNYQSSDQKRLLSSEFQGRVYLPWLGSCPHSWNKRSHCMKMASVSMMGRWKGARKTISSSCQKCLARGMSIPKRWFTRGHINPVVPVGEYFQGCILFAHCPQKLHPTRPHFMLSPLVWDNYKRMQAEKFKPQTHVVINMHRRQT